MPFMDWLAFKHPLLVHLPVAAALLLPIPLLAAQRAGRGIKPWWIAARYLGWVALLGTLPALLSGLMWAKLLGLIHTGKFIAVFAKPGEGLPYLISRHQLWGMSCLPLGVLTVWSMHRARKEHEGLGWMAFIFGCLWSFAALNTGRIGGEMTHPLPLAQVQNEQKSDAKPAPEPVDPELDSPIRALDYLSLEPMQAEPMKSPAHGGRWIRVWVTASGAEAYRAGKPLPPGAYAVMSTVEDRYGRPSQEPGPLYALESLANGKPSLTLYWPRVPEAKRAQVGGAASVYWRTPDPNLKSCMACHTDGAADMAKRSTWKVPRSLRLQGGKVVEEPSVP